MIYFVQCFIDPDKSSMIEVLKKEHLNYIAKRRHLINYGGVVGSKQSPYQQICFYLRVQTRRHLPLALSKRELDKWHPWKSLPSFGKVFLSDPFLKSKKELTPFLAAEQLVKVARFPKVA